MLCWIFIALPYWKNRLWVDMSENFSIHWVFYRSKAWISLNLFLNIFPLFFGVGVLFPNRSELFIFLYFLNHKLTFPGQELKSNIASDYIKKTFITYTRYYQVSDLNEIVHIRNLHCNEEKKRLNAFTWGYYWQLCHDSGPLVKKIYFQNQSILI